MTIKGYAKFIFDGKMCEIIPMYDEKCVMYGFRIIMGDDISKVTGYRTKAIFTKNTYFNIIFEFHDGMKELKITKIRKEGGML